LSDEIVYLHNHSLFSLLDGLASPEEYFQKCHERKWPAFAVTEHGVLNSIPDSYLASKQYGVKYICGCEFYFSDYDHIRRKLAEDSIKVGEWRSKNVDLADRVFRHRHIVVLVKNQKGYENLLKINLVAWKEGFYRKPRVCLDLLAKYKEGLIILSGCLNSPICHELRKNNLTTINGIVGAIDYVKKFKRIFGDDFYIELQMPGVPDDLAVYQKLVAIADYLKIKSVITNDVHYIAKNEYILQKVMMAIDQQLTMDDPNLFSINSDEQYLKTRPELRKTCLEKGYANKCGIDVFEKACDNTMEVADKCSSLEFDMGPKLPVVENADNELRRLAEEGLRKKGLDKDTERYLMDERQVTHKEQMELELQRIIEKKFSAYFLITRDLIQSSINKGYPVGCGRGSISGSLVPYLIGITTINPLVWGGLSFNRFLSPARGGNMLVVSMPEEK